MALCLRCGARVFETRRQPWICRRSVRSFVLASTRRPVPVVRRLYAAFRVASSGVQGPTLHSDESTAITKDNSEESDVTEEPIVREEAPQSVSFWKRVKNWFKVDKSRLQNLGMGAFLAYGFVSNLNYGVFFTIAWLSHVKRTGLLPFAPGQWKAFLGVYAGLWALQNILRPARIAAAIALTPLVDQMLQYLVTKLGIQRRQAFILLIFGLAVFTMSSLITGIWILGGVPSRPPPAV